MIMQYLQRMRGNMVFKRYFKHHNKKTFRRSQKRERIEKSKSQLPKKFLSRGILARLDRLQVKAENCCRTRVLMKNKADSILFIFERIAGK